MIGLKLDSLNKQEWDSFNDAHERGYFLQSWAWGEFWKSQGKKISRIAIANDDAIIGIALCLFDESRFGSYVYIPRGPVIDWGDSSLSNEVVDQIKKHFEDKGVGFVRMDPPLIKDSSEAGVFGKSGFKRAAKYMQAERAWALDIKSEEQEQTKWMKENGMRSNFPRYFRRAAREGVKITISDNPKGISKFYEILKQTSERKGMSINPYEYYQKEMESLSKDGRMKLFFAELEGRLLAAAMIAISPGNEASYLHGASADGENDRKLRAPHLMHWEVIKYCIDNNIKTYNMWGTLHDDKMDKDHPGYGFSQFKRSFGGYMVEYMRTADYVYKPVQYNLFKAQEKYRNWKLRSHLV